MAARSGPALRPISLRVVQSIVEQHCTLPPLTGDQSGSACDTSGAHTYSLGPSLGEVLALRASVSRTRGSAVRVHVGDAGRSTLVEVRGGMVGQRIALVVSGVVFAAPEVRTPLASPDLELATPDPADAQSLLDRLAAPAEGRRPA